MCVCVCVCIVALLYCTAHSISRFVSCCSITWLLLVVCRQMRVSNGVKLSGYLFGGDLALTLQVSSCTT